MKIEVLGGYGGESLGCRMTCLLINDTIALDAGSLSQALLDRAPGRGGFDPALTHSHMDHTSSIPVLHRERLRPPPANDRHLQLFGHRVRDPQVPVQQRHLAGLHPPAESPVCRRSSSTSCRTRAGRARRRPLHADRGRPSGADPRLPDRAGRQSGAVVERYRTDPAPVADRQQRPETCRRCASTPASTTRCRRSPTSPST